MAALLCFEVRLGKVGADACLHRVGGSARHRESDPQIQRVHEGVLRAWGADATETVEPVIIFIANGPEDIYDEYRIAAHGIGTRPGDVIGPGGRVAPGVEDTTICHGCGCCGFGLHELQKVGEVR